jgi:hypothetical protein
MIGGWDLAAKCVVAPSVGGHEEGPWDDKNQWSGGLGGSVGAEIGCAGMVGYTWVWVFSEIEIVSINVKAPALEHEAKSKIVRSHCRMLASRKSKAIAIAELFANKFLGGPVVKDQTLEVQLLKGQPAVDASLNVFGYGF